MLGLFHALQLLCHGHVCGTSRGSCQYLPHPGFMAHLAGPTSHPEPQSLDPSAPGSDLVLGSRHAGGPQWLPAPASDGPGGVR